jgi:hypothetical protein
LPSSRRLSSSAAVVGQETPGLLILFREQVGDQDVKLHRRYVGYEAGDASQPEHSGEDAITSTLLGKQKETLIKLRAILT